MHRIRSRGNQRLKDIRRLRRSKGAHWLLEGPHLIGAALDASLPLEHVLATPEFLSSDHPLLARLAPEPQVVEARLLEELADADTPRGIVALAAPRPSALGALPCRRGRPYLYLDRLQDPGNAGALARAAEAAGASGLCLAPGSVRPEHPRALRASAGSLLRLPLATEATPAALAQHLAPAGAVWVALVPHGGVDLFSNELPETPVLVLGSEGQGLSAELEERATLRLSVPLASPVESLNVAIAGAVVLFELRRRRGAQAD